MRYAGFAFRKSIGWLLALSGILLVVLLYVVRKVSIQRTIDERNDFITLPPREPDVFMPREPNSSPSVEPSSAVLAYRREDTSLVREEGTDADLELASLDPVTSGLTETIAPSTADDPSLHTDDEPPPPASDTLDSFTEQASEEATADVTELADDAVDGSEPAHATTAPVGAAVEVAYCVKCRQKQTMLSPKRSVTKNGRAALVGQCAVCGTRLFRFVPA